MAKNSYPLCWPDGWKRTQPNKRVDGKFRNRETKFHTPIAGQPSRSYQQSNPVSIRDSVMRLLKQLEMMGVLAEEAIVSTNIEPRLDGMPRSGEKKPIDPGAAVYWEDKGQQRCMAIDRYSSVADNLAAIAATLEAMRAIERHGGAEILTRAFLGFATLPENAESWRDLLGFANGEAVTADSITHKFRSALLKAHPDQGGTAEHLRKVVKARDEAMKEIQYGPL